MAKQQKKPLVSPKIKLFFILLLLPVTIALYMFIYMSWQQLRGLPFFEEFTEKSVYEQIQTNFDLAIPIEYIPIYVAAEQKYNVPWTLLAAHHRIETRFSTMSTLISPVGAEGHMQVRP